MPLDEIYYFLHNGINTKTGVLKSMHKLLPLLLIIAGFLYLGFNYQTVVREIAYSFNISGDPTTSCCDEDVIANSNGQFDEEAATAVFNNKVIDYPKTSLAYSINPSLSQAKDPNAPQVLGTTNTAGEEKWIEVSLSEQRLRAWEGNRIVMEFPISSGKWYPTPTGDYSIWYKTRAQKMEGGNPALGTYYNLPNVPHNMFFYKGFAIHGAYWHNNFGTPMSHGCVNSPLANVAQLFEWTGPVLPSNQNALRASSDNPGTRVFVH